MNKAEFARFLGIPAPMYHRYENGQIPKADYLRVISEKTGKSVDWLLGRGEIKDTSGLSSSNARIGMLKLQSQKTDQECAESLGLSEQEYVEMSSGKRAVPANVLKRLDEIEAEGKLPPQKPASKESVEYTDLPSVYRQIAHLFSVAADLIEKEKSVS